MQVNKRDFNIKSRLIFFISIFSLMKVSILITSLLILYHVLYNDAAVAYTNALWKI
ncbi:hypothetical protein BC941DRAFT_428358 [Chlamydoabsidia padenii]|nr:hypothetical protein BC941DRAFT_428358 [Chlamydoabsidia padenii]